MSSQTEHPWRATARTLAQTIIGAVLALGIVLPAVWAIVRDELAKQSIALPEQAVAIIGAVVAGVVAASAILARVMAIPEVDGLLKRLRLSSTPDPEPRRAKRAA